MDDVIHKKMQALRLQYTKSLPDKIAAIEAGWQRLQTHWDESNFQTYHREVHSLCGSAGTYGYLELSQCARQMEIYLKGLLNCKILSQVDQGKISDFVEALRIALENSPAQDSEICDSELEKQSENKVIYVLVQDKPSVEDILESLEYSGFQAYPITDLITLERAVNEKAAVAIILDTIFLKQDGADYFQRIQQQQQTPSHVICIVPNSDLKPRLEAIRAGCFAFFQKPLDSFHLTQTVNQKLSVSAFEAYRILIVEDSASLAEYYSLILNQAGMITRAIVDPMTLLDELADFQPHLILMDIYMPDCTGLELAAVLRFERRYTKIPIIFLSTEDDRRKQLSAMSLGGDDFLTKPISPQHLVSAVRSRSKRAGMLNYFMTSDSLTGLLNHSSVLGRLEMEVAHARQKKIPLTFMMIDIDHFKKINDSYGHPVGDLVLKKLATLLQTRLRAQDIIGRYGGEEFVIILPGSDCAQSLKIGNELREQFSRYDFTQGNHHFTVTFSAGIACLRNGNDAHSIVVEADQALYQAKGAGRNQVISFESILK
jgi:diguanylate cyclase (GGDEF)-like protein